MIIKYYNKGWNYIDNAENVKWINKTLEKVDTLPRDKIGGRIYISNGDMEALEQRVNMDICLQLENYNCLFIGVVDYQIDYDEVKRLLKKKENVYVRCILYKVGDVVKTLLFTHAGYLLNDSGQTIERLG